VSNHIRSFIFLLAAALLPAPALAAELIPYDVSVVLSGDNEGVPFNYAYALYDLPTVYQHGTDGGTYILDADQDLDNGAQAFSTSDFEISWQSTYDVDPFVTNIFSITNFSGSPITIDITVTSPVVPTGPATTMMGSVGLTLTNTGGVATASTSSSIDLYTALIDGLPVASLLDDPYTLTEAVVFGTETGSDAFGPAGGPAATTSIGIRIRLVLSPGDLIGVTSIFNIEAAPEPALLGLGTLLVGLALIRRRA
jgi:hypothetical protein